ncbi:sensor histidine kinase [Nonomuraea typhae]|uniref:sensor histidine kinase n=1 Tax=Nonomuraea typhae TaxID=2603600 RepID=UPI001FE3EE19|nr:histidine kinase [Nonomuraea typhae]
MWLDLLGPGERRPRPSRRALVADLLVALVLAALAVTATVSTENSGPHPVPLRLQPVTAAPAGDAPQGPPPLLVIATALPLAARRTFPLTAFWTVLLAALATHDDATWITVLSCAVAAYSAMAYGRHQALATAGLAVASVLAGVAFHDTVGSLPGWLGPFTVLLSAGVVAGSVRLWRRRAEEARRAQQDARRTQQEATRRAVEQERARIARELHDVVTHNVNVMIIQAGAARKVMDAAPERSKQAMLAVEAGGRAAMAELRHVMGLLAGPGDEQAAVPADGLAPQPGLDQLDSLIERVRAAGLPVHADVAQPPGPLPPGVELAAYRVVQEALTNTMKHANGAAASVAIRYRGEWMEIEIGDTGGARAARAGDGQGRGLAGLRERLTIYGGTLRTGPSGGDGYTVLARLPWSTA